MASRKLSNYLRGNRKRLGLSQDDVAFLLGCRSGSKVCRYERFVRIPGLDVAFAFEVIFGKPACEIFAGIFKEVEEKVVARAKALLVRRDFQKKTEAVARKREVLSKIKNRKA
jgi:transcriptional regulator with XRE-family HTH domain